jgi:tetratricopeptide (TPR) repeat protein
VPIPDLSPQSQALLDQSLLHRATGPDGEPRFTMLETVREYARERLDSSGEADRMRQQHGAYFLVLAEQAEPDLWGGHQDASLKRLEAEHDNLRAALHWAFDRGEIETLMRLAGALWRFWLLHNHFTEGQRWLEDILGVGRGIALAARFKVCTGAGWMAWHRGEWAQAAVFHQQALALARELEDRQSMATALRNLGIQEYEQSNLARATAHLNESIAIAREIGDKHGIAWALNCLGLVAEHRGEYAAGRALHDESLPLWLEVGDKWGIALAHMGFGGLAFRQGAYGQARAHFEQCLALWREVGDGHRIGSSLLDLGRVALAQGDNAAALALYEEGLAIEREVGSTWGIAFALAGLAKLALDQEELIRADTLYRETLALRQTLKVKDEMIECLEGLAGVAAASSNESAVASAQPERAAQLLGAAEALRQVLGVPLPPSQQIRHGQLVARARSRLDAAAFAAAWAAGQAMTLEAATAYALGDSASS